MARVHCLDLRREPAVSLSPRDAQSPPRLRVVLVYAGDLDAVTDEGEQIRPETLLEKLDRPPDDHLLRSLRTAFT